MSKLRLQRVSELIREVLADIMKKIKDPRIGFMTITDVQVTPDLSNARIFVSMLSEGEDREKAMKGLESASGFIRHELGKEIKLRKTPRISFHFDEGMERGMKILNILNQIKPDNDENKDTDNENSEENEDTDRFDEEESDEI